MAHIPESLKSSRKESFATKKFRWLMNLYPMFFATGGRILFISEDWREVLVRVKLGLWTYNYVGTIFGGSMFSAADPFYMIMFFNVLGDKYVVWDKAASVRFKRPGKKPIYCRFVIDEATLEDLKKDVAAHGEAEKTYKIQWVDDQGVVYSEIERLVYAADKDFYKEKLRKR